jgi:hypothetical protein
MTEHLRLGPPVAYVPVLLVPWHFPFSPGVVGWRREDHGDPRPLCAVTGERIDRDANTRGVR